jgi:hypothetical protein
VARGDQHARARNGRHLELPSCEGAERSSLEAQSNQISFILPSISRSTNRQERNPMKMEDFDAGSDVVKSTGQILQRIHGAVGGEVGMFLAERGDNLGISANCFMF